jgi:Mg/Co/Ni transporter MgtE
MIGWTSPDSASRRILDLAEEIERLEESRKSERLSQLPPPQQEEIFNRLRPAHQSEILRHLDQQSCRTLIESLEPDDQVRLLMHLPPGMAETVKSQLSPEKTKFIDQLLQYPEESAGRILTPVFLALSPGMTVGEALAVIREKGRELENILVLPVSDSDGRLIGLTKLEDLVYAGAQAATTMVRAMAVDDVRVGQIVRVAARESGIGLLLGTTLALVAIAAVRLCSDRAWRL